jgi:tRNA (guanine-N7-)-methyltransferase
MISPGAEPQQNQTDARDVEIFTRQFDDGLSLSAVFGNGNPLEIEIGSGKGRFLISAGRNNPGTNYIGIERAYKFFHLMKERVEQAALPNVRLLRAEADYFIWGYVPHGSVQAFHIYFPDPWPKTKHRRRRIVSPDFFDVLRDRLLPGGCINLATDFADYFTVMLKTGRGCAGLEELYSRTIDPAEVDPESGATHYERKYLMGGRTIYRAAYKKQLRGPDKVRG